MLVLTRKPQQSVQIGDHIKVSVLRVRGNTIQLGIEAPKSVRVMRTEIIEREQNSVRSSTGKEGDLAGEPQSDEHLPRPENHGKATVTAQLVTAL